MDPLVFLDTNVLLAQCLDPSMDAKGALAALAFRAIKEEGVAPLVTESVQKEFDEKLRDRVGEILDALRRLINSTPLAPSSSAIGNLDMLERTFSKLRTEAPEGASALQLLEGRLARAFEDNQLKFPQDWANLLTLISAETTALLAEIQRRHDSVRIQIVRPSGRIDLNKFGAVVQTRDLDHIASIDAVSVEPKRKSLFVYHY